MRVFVTGATGFVGFAVVKDLIAAGHQVTGLARSDASAEKLENAGAKALRGDIEDLDKLREGAKNADGVIHTAFYHEITHLPLGTRARVILGGLPTGIVTRFLSAAVAVDRRALETFGEVLCGSDRPLVGTFGTIGMAPGVLATEDEPFSPASAGAVRASTEKVMRSLASQRVRTAIVRLPPLVHGQGDRNGFVPFLIKTAKKKGESAYLESGDNRWPAVHHADAARVFRLALEKCEAGAAYHAVAEEGIPFRTIAAMLGNSLGLPIVSKPLPEAEKQFSFLGSFVPADNPSSSALTRERLGWNPTKPRLAEDLQLAGYLK